MASKIWHNKYKYLNLLSYSYHLVTFYHCCWRILMFSNTFLAPHDFPCCSDYLFVPQDEISCRIFWLLLFVSSNVPLTLNLNEVSSAAGGAAMKQGFGVSLSHVENWGRDEGKGDSRKTKKWESASWVIQTTSEPLKIGHSMWTWGLEQWHEREMWWGEHRCVTHVMSFLKSPAGSFWIISAGLIKEGTN